MSKLFRAWPAVLAVAGGLLLAVAPVAGAKTVKWHEVKKVNGGSGVNALDCPSAKLCVAAGYSTVSVSKNPHGGKSAWKRHTVDRSLDSQNEPNSLTAVGCVSASACVVGDDNQNGWFASAPDSGSWSAFGFPYDLYVTIEAIGCSHMGNCTALSVDNHAISTSKLSATSVWNFVQLPGANANVNSTNIASISCPSRTCVLARSANAIYVTTDAGTKWKSVRIAKAKQVASVDCASAHFCIAGAFEGNRHVWISRNPASASSWHVVAKFNGSLNAVQSVACVSAKRCVVGGAGDEMYSSTNPTKRGSWKKDSVEGKYGQFNEISCPGTSLCAATDQFGDIYSARF